MAEGEQCKKYEIKEIARSAVIRILSVGATQQSYIRWMRLLRDNSDQLRSQFRIFNLIFPIFEL
jgi:hypothetical protein